MVREVSTPPNFQKVLSKFSLQFWIFQLICRLLGIYRTFSKGFGKLLFFLQSTYPWQTYLETPSKHFPSILTLKEKTSNFKVKIHHSPIYQLPLRKILKKKKEQISSLFHLKSITHLLIFFPSWRFRTRKTNDFFKCIISKKSLTNWSVFDHEDTEKERRIKIRMILFETNHWLIDRFPMTKILKKK